MNILVVDDEPLIRELMGDFLRDQGHNVEAAENDLVAWNKLTDPGQDFDVVLADIKMPVMDGRELLRKVWESKLKIPVVLISGQINVSDSDAKLVGAFRILHKPIEFAKILEALEEVRSFPKEGT